MYENIQKIQYLKCELLKFNHLYENIFYLKSKETMFKPSIGYLEREKQALVHQAFGVFQFVKLK